MALYYVAHRLFAAHDRALGAYIASRLARLAGADAVFLPFCDTDEENLVSELQRTPALRAGLCAAAPDHRHDRGAARAKPG